MSYIGKTPTSVPLTSSDITDGIISLPKLTDGTDGNLISYDASGNPVAVATGTDGQVLTSTGAGSPPVFETLPANTPAFEAYLSSDQVPSNDTETKINFNTENFDTDSCYDNATNYRFTPTTAGKYFVYSKVRFQSASVSQLSDTGLQIYKNGSLEIETYTLFRSNYEQAHTVTTYSVIDMNGSSDYLEVYGKLAVNSGSLSGFIGGNKRSIFGAYRILT